MKPLQSLKYIGVLLVTIFVYGVFLPEYVSAKDTLTVTLAAIFGIMYTWGLVHFVIGEVEKFNKKDGK